jgi:hypothetical protein
MSCMCVSVDAIARVPYLHMLNTCLTNNHCHLGCTSRRVLADSICLSCYCATQQLLQPCTLLLAVRLQGGLVCPHSNCSVVSFLWGLLRLLSARQVQVLRQHCGRHYSRQCTPSQAAALAAAPLQPCQRLVCCTTGCCRISSRCCSSSHSSVHCSNDCITAWCVGQPLDVCSALCTGNCSCEPLAAAVMVWPALQLVL